MKRRNSDFADADCNKGSYVALSVQWQLATCDPNYETGVANTIPPAWLLLHPLMTDL